MKSKQELDKFYLRMCTDKELMTTEEVIKDYFSNLSDGSTKPAHLTVFDKFPRSSYEYYQDAAEYLIVRCILSSFPDDIDDGVFDNGKALLKSVRSHLKIL